MSIDGPLWSARALIEQPDVIARLHAEYLEAGADVVISASYQATFEGFAGRGIGREQAADLMRRGVALAIDARNAFWSDPHRDADRRWPLVAASIGPYGAWLHDGSEFRGDYGLSVDELARFHADRFAVLAGSDADLLACETIPSLAEAEALLAVLTNHPRTNAWFSFACADEKRLCHGEPIAECAKLLDASSQVIALGINCTDPSLAQGLITELRAHTRKPIVVYPNSGETWDGKARRWSGTSDPEAFAALAERWYRAGARLIGGCCRTGPQHVIALARRLRPHRMASDQRS